MKNEFSYQQYVTDQRFLNDYNAYQAKYATRIRDSDRVIIDLVREELTRREGETKSVATALDIGCSTGNLLLHLKREFGSRLDLIGGDLAESSLGECRNNPDLQGVRFERMDIFALPAECFDIVVVNAVLYMFDKAEFARAWTSISRSLRAGGRVIVYDFAHPFAQNIEIIEETSSHPDGLRLCFRPMANIETVVREVGFDHIVFKPFTLSIDLDRPDDHEIITYTIKDETGRRLAFRGALFQPWCHMIVWKTDEDYSPVQV